MKIFAILAAIVICSLPLRLLAADQVGCKSAAKGFADVVVQARKFPESHRQKFVLDQARGEDFLTLGSRMTGKALNLVDTSLSSHEVQTELYAYCMNQ